MLHQVSWEQFWVAGFIFCLAWYAGLAVLYYRQGLRKVWKGKDRFSDREKPEPLKHAWEDEYPAGDVEEADDLMGKTVEPAGLTRVSMTDLCFAPRVARSEDQEDMLGLIPDVLEEIRVVIKTVEDNQGDKGDFIGLFKLVSGKYPKVKQSGNLPYVLDWIAEHVPFELSEEELEGLWA
jgi:hypothetical protein